MNEVIKEVKESKRPDMLGNQYAVNNFGTKYGPSTIALVDKYIDGCVDKRVRAVKSEVATGKSYEISTKVNLPTQAGLAIALDVTTTTIKYWTKKYPDFADKMERLKLVQHDMLINGGLSGRYNASITKLLLSKHGYYDEERVQHTGLDGGPIEVLIEERKKKIYDIARLYDIDAEEEVHDQEGSDTTVS